MHLLFIYFAVLFSSACRPSQRIIKELSIIDSIEFAIPISLYSDDLGSPDFKINLQEQKAYFFSQDDKKIIVYDINKNTFCTYGTEILRGRQHFFNFTLVDSTRFVLYANPTYNGGFYDKTIISLTDDGLQEIPINFEQSNIRTSTNHKNVNYYTSTFLLPIRMEPIWLADSSVIFPCSYDKVPGTLEHDLLNKGQFVKLHRQKKAEYLPIKFTDEIPTGTVYSKSLSEPYGFRLGDSMIFAYGNSNDINIYSISKNTEERIIRKNPLVEKLHSCDTANDSWNDFSQNQFMYLIYNPILDEYYRIVKLTSGQGYLLILMNSKFEEIGIYSLPETVQWPFHYSPNGIYAYKKKSYDLEQKYIFIELAIFDRETNR